MERGAGRTRRGASDEKTAAISRRFLQQARADIGVAGMLLRPGAYYKAVECAHQAAEKSLKALAWRVGLRGGGKDDLVAIAQRVARVTGVMPDNVDSAVKYLEPLWSGVRYPSGRASDPIPAEAFGEDDAVTAIRLANGVVAWVDGELQRL